MPVGITGHDNNSKHKKEKKGFEDASNRETRGESLSGPPTQAAGWDPLGKCLIQVLQQVSSGRVSQCQARQRYSLKASQVTLMCSQGGELQLVYKADERKKRAREK